MTQIQHDTLTFSRAVAFFAAGVFCGVTLMVPKLAMHNKTTGTNTNSKVLVTNTDPTRVGQDAVTQAWEIDDNRIFVTDIDGTRQVCLNLHGTAAESMVPQTPGQHDFDPHLIPALMEAIGRPLATAEGSCTVQTNLLADETKSDGDEEPTHDA